VQEILISYKVADEWHHLVNEMATTELLSLSDTVKQSTRLRISWDKS